ncbi:hypothetical protein SAMN05421820_101487 [Pedobacter steynii]|uniref:Uncharacterized protein n=1 Tax=Pedobacter steynii TaxID=430522 RepID=A0A1G9K6Q9_9SPHI|nr:hypothetical protein [Pedobacter steynii]NQX38466.1 hypothetical protein [Pedobacter steynii]SDL45438.1 hypothetical protein SAMN05421820_101487 [Pedobacter steynii]
MKTTAINNNNTNGKADHTINPVLAGIKPNNSPSAVTLDGGKAEVKEVDVKAVNDAEVDVNVAGEQPKREPVVGVKPALNLEQTLQLVADLAKKTALRDRYNGYIDQLKSFVIAQNDEDDMAKSNISFKGCELTIRDGEGNVFRTESAMVIGGTVEFMTTRFTERLAEVEAEIVIPI